MDIWFNITWPTIYPQMVMLGRKIKLIDGIEGDIECYFIECDQQGFSKEGEFEIEPWWKREWCVQVYRGRTF